MIISHSRRYVFLHVHKAAGTSIELLLSHFLSWNDLILGSSDLGEAHNDCYRSQFGLHKHSSLADVERVCGAEIVTDYFVFATVRHPLSRICSLYNFIGSTVARWDEDLRHRIATGKIHDDPAAAPPEAAWPATAAYIQTPDFSKFIRNDALLGDDAFQTQFSRLRSASHPSFYATALRIEHQHEWHGRLKAVLQLPVFVMPHVNQSAAELTSPAKVSPKDRRYIEQRFSDDYSVFDYASSA